MSGGNRVEKLSKRKENWLMLLHLGLGDFFICNGLVREWLSRNPDANITLPCRDDNLVTVSWMYRDLGSRVELIEVPRHDPYPVIFRQIRPKWPSERIVDLTMFSHGADFKLEEFDREFYRWADIDYRHRWDSFYYKRDRSKELKVRPKIICHDDPTRHFTISRKRFPRIRNATHPRDLLNKNLLNLVGVLEEAEELHAINSCIFCLMENLQPNPDQKRFWHIYPRPEVSIPVTKLHWEEIN